MHVGKTGEFPALSILRSMELRGAASKVAGGNEIETVSDSRSGQGLRFVGKADKLTISAEARRLAKQHEDNPFGALVDRERNKQHALQSNRQKRREMQAREALMGSRAKLAGSAHIAEANTQEHGKTPKTKRQDNKSPGLSREAKRSTSALLEKREQLHAQRKEARASKQSADAKKKQPLVTRDPLAEKNEGKGKPVNADFVPGPFIELESESESGEEFQLPGEESREGETR